MEKSRQEFYEESFDRALRQDMESFRDCDAEAFREVHHPDAVSVFAVGEVAIGRTRSCGPGSVRGCRTPLIVYRSLIERPGLTRHALNTVTYTFEKGRWLVISDQGTEVGDPTAG